MMKRRHHPERAGAAMSRILEDAPVQKQPPQPSAQTRPHPQAQPPAQTQAESSGPPAAVVAAFRRAAGDLVATHAFVKYLRKGVLTIGVDSSVWLQELSLLKQKLATNMSREVGEQITTINLVISKMRRQPQATLAKGSTAPLSRSGGAADGRSAGHAQIAAHSPMKTEYAVPMPDLPPSVKAEVEKAVAPLDGDPELAEAAMRALSRWRARK